MLGVLRRVRRRMAGKGGRVWSVVVEKMESSRYGVLSIVRSRR